MIRTDWFGEIVQTHIRLLLEEQSDQGLHYLHYSSTFKILSRCFLLCCVTRSIHQKIKLFLKTLTKYIQITSPKMSAIFLNLLYKHLCHMSRIIRKPAFCICKNKSADQMAATLIPQYLYFLNPKFQALSYIL